MVDHHVVRLHVPVHDPHTVTVVQSLKEETETYSAQPTTSIYSVSLLQFSLLSLDGQIRTHEAIEETTSMDHFHY